MLTLLFTHPNEFRILVQYKLYHDTQRDITAVSEHPTSGWDRESMRKCWGFLDATSRSFSAVIKELDGDLARVVCSTLRRGFRGDQLSVLDQSLLPRAPGFGHHRR